MVAEGGGRAGRRRLLAKLDELGLERPMLKYLSAAQLDGLARAVEGDPMLAGLLSQAASHGAPATLVSPDVLRMERLPPGQRLVDRLPVLHEGEVPDIERSAWSLSITGLVERGRMVSFGELSSLPRVRLLADIHCVTGWSRLGAVWDGVRARDVLALASPRPEARFALARGVGGYSTDLPLADLLQDDALVAFGLDGSPLPPEHGGPVRLVVPRLYLWKSAKWLEGIELMAEDRDGYWESRGYHRRGDPWREERRQLSRLESTCHVRPPT